MTLHETILKRGEGKFFNCTDYDDAVKAMDDQRSYYEWAINKGYKPSGPRWYRSRNFINETISDKELYTIWKGETKP